MVSGMSRDYLTGSETTILCHLAKYPQSFQRILDKGLLNGKALEVAKVLITKEKAIAYLMKMHEKHDGWFSGRIIESRVDTPYV